MQYLSGIWKDDHKCNLNFCQQLSSFLFLGTNRFLFIFKEFYKFMSVLSVRAKLQIEKVNGNKKTNHVVWSKLFYKRLQSFLSFP